MITFSRIGEHGRLGNQLFQYAILLVVGEKNGYEIKIPNLDNKIWHGQKCLLNNFNISAGYLKSTDYIGYNYIEPQNENFTYNSNIFNIPDNTDILGFFQNYQYYKNHIDLIKEEFTLKSDIIDYNYEILNKLKENHSGYEIISLHLRRGDSDLSMYDNNGLLNSKWYKYFIEAKKEFIGKKVKFLIFTGGNRKNDNNSSEYDWCYDNFKSDEFIILDRNSSTINDFSLMQLCDHNILSPISSFSWWIGFLNTNKNKKIISPNKYYFLNSEMDNGFYPPEFILK